MRHGKFLRFAMALMALALPVFVTVPAQAGLTIDLRLPTGDPKFPFPFPFPGNRIPIDVYAIVTGTSSGIEGFQSAQGAFVGVGDLAGSIVPAGDLDEATFTTTLPAIAPFNGNGAQPGASKRITGADPVIDLGDTPNRSDLGDLVVFRANSMQVTSGAVIPDGREFKIGRIEFVMEGGGFCATINWVFRRGPGGEAAEAAALFRQDGVIGNGTGAIASGAPITIICPEPSCFVMFAACTATLVVRRRTRPSHAGIVE